MVIFNIDPIVNHMSRFYFTEEQKFNPILIWAILSPIVIIIGIQLFEISSNGEDINLSNEILISLGVTLTIVAAVAVLFMNLKLTLNIDKVTVRIKFYPFVNRQILWTDVEEAKVITYKPLLQYGGWGIRRRMGSIAYSVSGKQGLQLNLRNGKKVLIGTKKAEELKNLLLKRTESDEY